MADAAVTFLLETVKEVLVSYANVLSSAENEFKQLEKELASLKALLEKAEDMTDKDQIFKELERQIREGVHDAEDTIEDCLTTLRLAPKPKCCFFRLGDGGTTKFNIARAVKSVRDGNVTPLLKRATEQFNLVERFGKGVEQRPTTAKKVTSVTVH
ncbi:hypothetical protein CDL12_05245 [Handroanthus impetiginosus]|uniref:Disease resistance N-terminal domain-containing protein n=1 Tax=Handroanthus impetiginosus TaxID=429701 RepID=A0A2G9HX03_9LAMI|nr:hypothetical protein CDL12_05245 [Handroanthus impetiginosus]